ncbi:hypothetical protein INO08_16820, partial [Staphylococcus aureus]|nr:hypothetical protein [Staphylococcus aureus]
NGQCFGWRRVGLEPVWVGVLGRRVLALRQTETDCLFRCLGALPPLPPSPSPPAADVGVRTLRSELEEYFQLATPLA